MICDFTPLRTSITTSLVVAMTGWSWGAESVYDKSFSQLLITKNNSNFLVSVSKETVDMLGGALNFFMIPNGDRILDGRSSRNWSLDLGATGSRIYVSPRIP